jgi:hypothetical protein
MLKSTSFTMSQLSQRTFTQLYFAVRAVPIVGQVPMQPAEQLFGALVFAHGVSAGDQRSRNRA